MNTRRHAYCIGSIAAACLAATSAQAYTTLNLDIVSNGNLIQMDATAQCTTFGPVCFGGSILGEIKDYNLGDTSYLPIYNLTLDFGTTDIMLPDDQFNISFCATDGSPDGRCYHAYATMHYDQDDGQYDIPGWDITTPDFANGTPRAVRVIASVASVPEPASWAFMIVGFGLAGIALRQRRASVAYA